MTEFLRQHPEFSDSKKISWNRALKTYSAKNVSIEVESERVYRSLYRPYSSQIAYFDQALNDMVEWSGF